MAGEDPEYLRRVRELPCCACGRVPTYSVPSHPHHAGIEKGMALKPHDHTAIPLCYLCHTPGIHSNAGFFKNWKKQQLREWQDARIAETQARLGLVEAAA